MPRSAFLSSDRKTQRRPFLIDPDGGVADPNDVGSLFFMKRIYIILNLAQNPIHVLHAFLQPLLTRQTSRNGQNLSCPDYDEAVRMVEECFFNEVCGHSCRCGRIHVEKGLCLLTLNQRVYYRIDCYHYCCCYLHYYYYYFPCFYCREIIS